jgi:hypothetical protein
MNRGRAGLKTRPGSKSHLAKEPNRNRSKLFLIRVKRISLRASVQSFIFGTDGDNGVDRSDWSEVCGGEGLGTLG